MRRAAAGGGEACRRHREEGACTGPGDRGGVAGGRAAPSRRWEGRTTGAARLAREGARRTLPARVAPQLPVAQRRRVNLPVSVGQGLPGEQQLVAAPAAQRRRRQGAGQGSQPAS